MSTPRSTSGTSAGTDTHRIALIVIKCGDNFAKGSRLFSLRVLMHGISQVSDQRLRGCVPPVRPDDVTSRPYSLNP